MGVSGEEDASCEVEKEADAQEQTLDGEMYFDGEWVPHTYA